MTESMHMQSSATRLFKSALIAAVLAGLIAPVLPEPVAAASTVTPVADSYVEAGRPTRNNGTKAQLRVDGSPILTAYLRFDVSGATDFSSATLRVFSNSTSRTGFAVHPVADTAWGETTITYANAPSFGTATATSGALTAGAWVAVDVSSLVAQNGLVSLALTGIGTTAVTMASRETTTGPELIVGASGPPPPPPPTGTDFVVSRDGTTATYRATSTDASYVGTLKSVVESAIAQLDAGSGGTIAFTAGDFDLGTSQFELDDVANITFSGAGIGSTIIRNFTSAASDTEPFDIVVGTNLVFRDFTVRAGGALRSTSDALDFDAGNNILVERVAVTESRSKGIIFDGKGAGWTANGNIVRDCVISGIPSDGIELLASSGNLVEGCSISNVGGHGIQVVKSSTSAAQPNKKSNDNIVRNNTIDNAGQDGINVSSGDRNQVRSNLVTNSSDDTSGRDGIRIASNDSVSCDDNVVDLNTATDNQPTKTQAYGLNIANSLCSRTVVGGGNNFLGNRLGSIRDVGTGTIYEGTTGDTEPPAKPSGLAATAASGCQVDLAWSATTDNVGVSIYRIYRGGVLLDSVGGSTLAYSDTTTSPGTAYSYTIDAVDAATNVSPQSDPALVTTPSEACSLTLGPVADTYVSDAAPTTNYGTSTQLRADGSPVLTSYLLFNVQSAAPVTRAILSIWVNSSHSTGFSVNPVADTTWDETAMTAASAPAFGAAAAASGALTAGTWVQVDVTALIAGSGLHSFALTTASGTAMSLASREAGVTAPMLVLETH